MVWVRDGAGLTARARDDAGLMVRVRDDAGLMRWDDAGLWALARAVAQIVLGTLHLRLPRNMHPSLPHYTHPNLTLFQVRQAPDPRTQSLKRY